MVCLVMEKCKILFELKIPFFFVLGLLKPY